jgi:hypothetical protein
MAVVEREEDLEDTGPLVEMTAMAAVVHLADSVDLVVDRAVTMPLEADRAVPVLLVEMIATAVEVQEEDKVVMAKVVMAKVVALAARVDNNNMVVEDKAATVNKAAATAIIRRGIVLWDGIGCLSFRGRWNVSFRVLSFPSTSILTSEICKNLNNE